MNSKKEDFNNIYTQLNTTNKCLATWMLTILKKAQEEISKTKQNQPTQ